MYTMSMQDRYAEGRFLPPIDPSQDWFLVSGEEEGGYTILEFTRNWTTCDDRDVNIQVRVECHNSFRSGCMFPLSPSTFQ